MTRRAGYNLWAGANRSAHWGGACGLFDGLKPAEGTFSELWYHDHSLLACFWPALEGAVIDCKANHRLQFQCSVFIREQVVPWGSLELLMTQECSLLQTLEFVALFDGLFNWGPFFSPTTAVLGKVLSAVGSAQLLMSQKFQQFHGLCEQNLVSLALFPVCLFVFGRVMHLFQQQNRNAIRY